MLDIADNPGRYVSARPVFRFRRLLVRVSNRSGYRITGITVSLSGSVGNRPIWDRLQLHGLGAHGSFELDTGVTVGPKESAKAEARVVRARISGRCAGAKALLSVAFRFQVGHSAGANSEGASCTSAFSGIVQSSTLFRDPSRSSA